MARETEIERLVVRLVGDDKSYRAMMQNAALSTGDLARVSGEVENAQRQVNDVIGQSGGTYEDLTNSTTRTSNSFKFLGREVQQAGMLVSGFNAPAGMTVISLGGMTSSAGEAMHAYKALGISVKTVGALLAANPLAFAAGGVAVAGISAIAIAYKIAANEIENVIEKGAKLDDQLKMRQREFTNAAYKEAMQEEWLPFRADKLEAEMRKAYDMRARAEDEAGSLAKQIENISWYDVGGRLDKSMLQEEYNKALADKEFWHNEAKKLEEAAADTRKAETGRIGEIIKQQSKGALGDITALTGGYAQLALSEKEAARFAFMVKNEMLQYPNPTLLKAWEAGFDRLANMKVEKEVQSLSDAMEDMKNKAEEILDPLDSQLRITHELEKANREYARAHNEAVENIPKEISDSNKLIATEREHLKLLQEGKAVYDQYKDPLDKMIESQKRLKQLFESGGFEKGEKGARAYQKALAEAYGQAHKDYTAQFLGQQFDAIIGGTHAAERALYEYRLGMTKIPVEMARFGKPSGVDASKGKPSNFWSGYDDEAKATGRAMVSGIKSVAEGVRMLVEQGKNKSGQTISNANFN
jgi:hypothetical protein